MKWGVRRYQNYDGTYTKKGLARFNQASSDYDKANEKLRTAKSNYKSGSGSKSDYKNAKGEAKIAKRKMNQAYDSLKTDKMADEGKKLYKNGKTITSNNQKFVITQTATIVGANIARSLISQYMGDNRIANLSSDAILVGGTAVNGILYAKNVSENKKLRAYYAH
jgi:hypothetical protein